MGQAARLEAGRNEYRVGSGLEKVGERFVVTGDDPDAAAMTRRRRPEQALQRRVAGTQNHQPRTFGNQPVDAFAEKVHALLPGQSADHAEDDAVAGFQSESLLDLPLVRGPRSDSFAVV